MQVFLMWRQSADVRTSPLVTAVARTLETFYQELFQDRLKTTIICEGGVNLVYLELAICGWNRPFFERDSSGWALSIDYPIDANRILAELGHPLVRGERLLPKLGRTLLKKPHETLRRLSPPVALIWREQVDQETVHLQNDGLGFSQLLEYDDYKQWAVSNRVLAFRALGCELRMVKEEWAAKCVLGWMPGDLTGFRNITFLRPSTHLCVSRCAVTRNEISVLGDWIHPTPLTVAEAANFAADSLQEYLRAAEQCWDSAHAGLTGGFDSRAVAAAMLFGSVGGYYFRTRGFPWSYDVLIARKLTQIANLSHAVSPARALPPENSDALRLNMQRALKWQGSLTEHHALKTQLSDSHHLSAGDVNIMGQHGEIAAAYYLARLKALSGDAAAPEAWLQNHLLRNRHTQFRPEVLKQVQEIVRQAYAAGQCYGLHALSGLDFFYLYERTRRWASASQFMQTGKVIAPFLNPRMIMAAYSVRPEERLGYPFHRHTVERFYPRWSAVPYSCDLTLPEAKSLLADCTALGQTGGTFMNAKHSSAGPSRSSPSYVAQGSKLYDNHEYWRTAGRLLVEEAIAAEGIWTEIFLLSAVRNGSHEIGDHLTSLHLMQLICKSA